MRQYDRAACFVEALIEFGLWQSPEKAADQSSKEGQSTSGEESSSHLASLSRTAFLEYGRLLLTVGNVAGARFYATRAGGMDEAGNGSGGGNGTETLLKDVSAVETAFVQSAKDRKISKTS